MSRIADLLVSRRTIEQALTPRTAIVVVTHLYGKMAPIADICELCRSRGIAVVEDCAQAAGAHLDGRRARAASGTWPRSASTRPRTWAHWATVALWSPPTSGWRRAYAACASTAGTRSTGWSRMVGATRVWMRLQAAVLRVRLAALDQRNARRRTIAHELCERVVGERRGDGSGGRWLRLRGPPGGVRAPRGRPSPSGCASRASPPRFTIPYPITIRQVIGDTWLDASGDGGGGGQVLSLPCFPELEDERRSSSSVRRSARR